MPRNIRDPTQVQKEIVASQQQPLPDGDDRRSLPAQRQIHRPQITYHIDPGDRRQRRPIPQLRRHLPRRCMKGRMAVTGDQLHLVLQPRFRDKTQHRLTQPVPIFRM